MTDIELRVLKNAFNDMIESLALVEEGRVRLNADYYWALDPADVLDPPRSPQDPGLGRLSDCMNEIRAVVDAPERATTYHLVWLGDILRAIGIGAEGEIAGHSTSRASAPHVSLHDLFPGRAPKQSRRHAPSAGRPLSAGRRRAVRSTRRRSSCSPPSDCGPGGPGSDRLRADSPGDRRLPDDPTCGWARSRKKSAHPAPLQRELGERVYPRAARGLCGRNRRHCCVCDTGKHAGR